MFLSEYIYIYWGDGTNSFAIDLNTNILENTTPFLRIAATLVYRSFELVNAKFKQANKNNMLICILDSRVNSYPTTVCGTAFFLKITVKNSKILELQKKNTGGH